MSTLLFQLRPLFPIHSKDASGPSLSLSELLTLAGSSNVHDPMLSVSYIT